VAFAHSMTGKPLAKGIYCPVNCLLLSKALDVPAPFAFSRPDVFVGRDNRKKGTVGPERDIAAITSVREFAPGKLRVAAIKAG